MSRITLVWRNGKMVEKRKAAPVNLAPMIQSDLSPYVSPLGTGVVDGRYARREELKRHNCRELDPAEFKVEYTNKEFCERNGLPFGERD